MNPETITRDLEDGADDSHGALYLIERPDPRPYVPEWARPSNPTAGMSDAATAAYWKANAVRGDVLFSLRDGSNVPLSLGLLWLQLGDAIGAGPETAAHRRRACKLRSLWREWSTRGERDGAAADAWLSDAIVPYLREPAAPRRAPAVDWKARALAAEARAAQLADELERASR